MDLAVDLAVIRQRICRRASTAKFGRVLGFGVAAESGGCGGEERRIDIKNGLSILPSTHIQMLAYRFPSDEVNLNVFMDL